MKKTAEQIAAEKKAADEKKTAEDAAAAAEAEKATEEDGDDGKGKGKPAKTFTEAEVKAREKAAADKAEAAAKKKFEEEKDLDENERLKKENEELKSSNRLRDAKDVAVEALKKAGSNSPELLWKVVSGDLEFDDSGKIKNLETLVTGLKTDYADQFGEPKPAEGIDAGAGGGAGGQGVGKLTEESIKKMSPKEINENWEEVSKVLADSKD